MIGYSLPLHSPYCIRTPQAKNLVEPRFVVARWLKDLDYQIGRRLERVDSAKGPVPNQVHVR